MPGQGRIKPPTREKLLEWKGAIKLEKLGLGNKTKRPILSVAIAQMKLGKNGNKQWTHDEVVYIINQRLEEIKHREKLDGREEDHVGDRGR